MSALNKKLGFDNFTAHVRLSETNGVKSPRWTPAYINDMLMPHAGTIKKVWVCGPPVLNEMFDKTLG